MFASIPTLPGTGWVFIGIGSVLFLLDLFRFDLAQKYIPFLANWGFGFPASKWSCIFGSLVMIVLGIYDLYNQERLGLLSQLFGAFDHFAGEYVGPVIVVVGVALAGMDFYRYRQSLSTEEIENP